MSRGFVDNRNNCGPDFEKYAVELIAGIFPRAVLTPHPEKLITHKGATVPDCLFVWDDLMPVYFEFTSSKLRKGKDPKEDQRRILHAHVDQEFERVAALIFYGQNLGTVEAIEQSLAILERLALGYLNTRKAQSRTNYIAKSHVCPNFRENGVGFDFNNLLETALSCVPIRH